MVGHWEFLRFGIRDRLIRLICSPDNVESFAFEVSFFGLRYIGNLNCYLDWMLYFYGAYEKYELLLLRDLVEENTLPIFIDIGSNIGHHSLYMSQYCKSVYAFEPYKVVSGQLKQNIILNDIRNIYVQDVGLGSCDCDLDFFAPKHCNTGTGSFVPLHAALNNEFVGIVIPKVLSNLNLRITRLFGLHRVA